MDWIDIQVEKIRKKIQNSSLLQAAVWYVLLYAGLAAVCSALTIRILRRWLILWAQGVLDLSPCQGEFLLFLSQWCAYVWLMFWMILMLRAFYKNRLKKPLSILKNGVTEIKSQNLEFVLDYPSEDEMGDLCRSFEELRQYLIIQYEEMWKKIEEQKQLNAAFAHDLRTPLTVLKGYTEFLARYLPKGKVSQEKMQEILELMTGQLERLTAFSKTMKAVRSLDEYPVQREETELMHLYRVIEGIAEALNLGKEVTLFLEKTSLDEGKTGFLDENIILEVLDNVLSNAIRFANSGISITLETETIEEELFLLLYVEDDGPGFTPEELKQAVQPYYTEALEGEHFGIGLHICSMLCRVHGGTFSIANRMDGKGAIVSASFRISE